MPGTLPPFGSHGTRANNKLNFLKPPTHFQTRKQPFCTGGGNKALTKTPRETSAVTKISQLNFGAEMLIKSAFIYEISSEILNVVGLWEKLGEPRMNPRRHGENRKAPVPQAPGHTAVFS